MKVIFLDFDGVVCLDTEWGSRTNKKLAYKRKFKNIEYGSQPPWIRMDNFNQKAVSVLNSILEQTDCEIVVTSDWRLHLSLGELKDMFIKYGVYKTPIDKTISLNAYGSSKYYIEQQRIREIKSWLSQHPEVTHWVAVDDMDLSERFSPVSESSNGGLKNFVMTPKSSEGIKQTGIKDKILKFLI